jgi:hypothetical protein
MQDDPYPSQGGIEETRLAERRRPPLETDRLGQRGELRRVAAGENRTQPAVPRGVDDEAARVAGRAVDQQRIRRGSLVCYGPPEVDCFRRSAFAGPAIDAHTASSRFAGQARFSGCIAFTNWSRDEVAALLPPELTLAPNATAPDVHPVMFVFGDQADGALLFAGLPVPPQITYQELGIVVPFVRHRGGPHLHNWVPRMCTRAISRPSGGNATTASEGAGLDELAGPVFLATREDGAP